jgi:hypothetical protein
MGPADRGADQLEMISTDPRVMHAETRVPVSVILDCLAACMTVEELSAEYPAVTAYCFAPIFLVGAHPLRVGWV